MPYCPKCGVEVDYSITECPLCEFSIPKVPLEDNLEPVSKFPKAINTYPHHHEQLKKTIFLISMSIAICIIVIAILQNIYFYKTITWSKYSTVSLFCGIIYLYIILKANLSLDNFICAFGANTFFLLVLLDALNSTLDWSITLGLPFTLLATIFIIAIIKIIRKSDIRGFNIAAYIILFSNLYCIWIDYLICYNFKNDIRLTWSLIVSFICVPLFISLLYIHYKLPAKYKEKFKKKFHI